jgi:hypothetical protein
MLPSFCTDDVIVTRPALKAERGTQVNDWANATTHTVSGCSVQPVQGSTAWTDPRQAVTVRAVLFAPPNADIQSGDRIEYAGQKFSVDGAPMPWKSPTGAVSHVQCSLVDWRS